MSKIDITQLNTNQAIKLRDFLNSIIDEADEKVEDESTADPIFPKSKPQAKKRGRPKKEVVKPTPAKATLPKRKGGGKTIRVDRSIKQPNRFESMPEFNGEKGDIAVDKKLWKGHKPTERKEKANLIEMNCVVCRTPELVSPNMIFTEPGEKPSYTCNQCASRNHRRR